MNRLLAISIGQSTRQSINIPSIGPQSKFVCKPALEFSLESLAEKLIFFIQTPTKINNKSVSQSKTKLIMSANKNLKNNNINVCMQTASTRELQFKTINNISFKKELNMDQYQCLFQIITYDPSYLLKVNRKLVTLPYCWELVNQSSRNLEYIPQEFITFEMAMHCLKMDNNNINFVPDHLFEQVFAAMELKEEETKEEEKEEEKEEKQIFPHDDFDEALIVIVNEDNEEEDDQEERDRQLALSWAKNPYDDLYDEF